MKSIRILGMSIALLFIQACSHPIEIVGQGDVSSASGNRNCSLEDFQAAADVCSKNYVIGAYEETYYVTSRAGWKFDHWENYCSDAPPPNYDCSFNVGAATVRKHWGKTVPPIRAVFANELDAYPNDNRLRLNQIQVMGTHNSYHPYPAPEPMARIVREQFSFYPGLVGDYRHKPIYEQLDKLGVRHIELDVNADPEGGNFSERPLLATIGENTATGIPELDLPGLKVFHVPQIDAESTCPLFTQCLAEIKRWSDEHPGHVPIIIMIEIKDYDLFGTATYLPMTPWQVADYDRLDAEIRSVFPEEQLITPDDVRGNFATLNEAILTAGWPTLAQTRGKVMFTNCNCIGQPADRQRLDYEIGHENLEGRILFPNSAPGNPDSAVVHLEEPVKSQAEIKRLVKLGYFIRTRADANTKEAVANNTSRRDAAFSSGSQYIATDFPEPSVTASPYYFVQIPGGTPARCNPINAPAWCRPEDIENPAHLTRKP